MLSSPRSVFSCLFLGLAYLSASAEAGPMAWRLCDDNARPVSVQTVTLTPDPPVIGTPATFVVQGQTQQSVQAGTVDIDVSFGGVQIFGTTEDLCAKTTCPVMPGPISVTLIEALPPIAPPGEYSLRVTGRDASGEDLMCLDVDFELVLPTRAQQDTLTQQDKTSTY